MSSLHFSQSLGTLATGHSLWWSHAVLNHWPQEKHILKSSSNSRRNSISHSVTKSTKTANATWAWSHQEIWGPGVCLLPARNKCGELRLEQQTENVLYLRNWCPRIKLHKLFLELFNGTFIWDPKGLAEWRGGPHWGTRWSQLPGKTQN